ncbi:MAG: hypothetical protein COS89_02385 [Deltaproteobacteria bacterium CG07_land_8_20_14_0_80_38_7]|nr:MAG: hypothetical protein COS89_02385 [Deltaproteobacteria bacterium CG07_land_8_20_14_0_80_38_7]
MKIGALKSIFLISSAMALLFLSTIASGAPVSDSSIAPMDIKPECMDPLRMDEYCSDILDNDGDHVVDFRDRCPTAFGTQESGCPCRLESDAVDSDCDGTRDFDDECNHVFGLGTNKDEQGCPCFSDDYIRRVDGLGDDADCDTIIDSEDDCIYQKGYLKYNGCPPSVRKGSEAPEVPDAESPPPPEVVPEEPPEVPPEVIPEEAPPPPDIAPPADLTPPDFAPSDTQPVIASDADQNSETNDNSGFGGNGCSFVHEMVVPGIIIITMFLIPLLPMLLLRSKKY